MQSHVRKRAILEKEWRRSLGNDAVGPYLDGLAGTKVTFVHVCDRALCKNEPNISNVLTAKNLIGSYESIHVGRAGCVQGSKTLAP